MYSYIKKRSLLVLDAIINSEDKDNEINDIDTKLFEMISPKTFHGSGGLEIKLIRNFEKTCVMLTKYRLSTMPKSMTTLAFYESVEALNEIIKQSKRNGKN